MRMNVDVRDGTLDANNALANATQESPDVPISAYPDWTIQDLALHVIDVYAKAGAALRHTRLRPPSPAHPQLATGRSPSILAAEVRRLLRDALFALDICTSPCVWTPAGPQPPRFWARRLLREAILHRWDAEQAVGRATAPTAEQALVLISEFIDTDLRKALETHADVPSGQLLIKTPGRWWRVDMEHAVIRMDGEVGPLGAVIIGSPASIWLWLVRRATKDEKASLIDLDGTGRRFTELIDAFREPTR